MKKLIVGVLVVVGASHTAVGQTNTVDRHRGEYVEYEIATCTNRLSSAWLTLRTDPTRSWVMPQKGGQGGRDLSAYTVYTDIDGDSVFDAMVQNRKDGMKFYILCSNTWIEVQGMMNGFGPGEVRRSVSDNRKYIFRGHAWELLDDAGKGK